jgi:hypothetical protein
MKTYKLIIISILALVAVNCKNQQESSMADKFRGMWKLDKFESFDSISGKWGDEVTRIGYSGYILYDGLGHMAVHLMPKIYGEFDPDKNPDSLNCEDLKQLLKIYKTNYVYFADYKIENGRVFHTKLSATNTKDKGTIAVRDFEFNGDTLILKPKEKINGLRLRLRWIKI